MRLANQLAGRGFVCRQFGRPIAVALADACGHKIRAQDTRADLVGDQLKVLVQSFGEGHHSVFAHVVNAHVGRGEQAGHAGGVDNVPPVRRIGFGRGQHHGREQADPVHHAPEVDAHHPFPVCNRVFPNQTPCAHPGVVEDEMGSTKPGLNLGSQLRHGLGVGDIEAARHHLNACGQHLGFGFVQGVLLHIEQHQVHAALGTDAGALQTKAGAGTGQNRCLALKILNHVVAFLSVKPMRGKCTCTVPVRASLRRRV